MNTTPTGQIEPLSLRVTVAAQAKARAAGDGPRHRAALHLLDWIGCALGGAQSIAGKSFLACHPGKLLDGSPTEVAQRLGGLGSLLEMDDVDRRGLLHPGPVVCAAAISVADDKTSGQLFLEAILAGYEVMIRLGRALGPGHYAHFHNSSTTGAFGAAVAAGHLLGLTPEAMTSAAGHALSMAGGLWECRNSPTATKHLHVAEAARRGVQAALWAKGGLAGPPLILEGPQGFFAGLARDGRPEAMEEPAEHLLIHDVSFKIWPACRHAHAAIDAALIAGRGLRPAEIVGAEVAVFRDSVVFCDRPEPRSMGEAKFSLQHAVAVCLAYGAPQMQHFEGAFLSDPALAALRPRIRVVEDPALTARYPAHFGATVTLSLYNGEQRRAEVPDAWGDSENPASPADVEAKFHAIARHVGLDPSLAEDIRRAIEAMGQGRAEAGALIRALTQIPAIHA